MASKPIDKCCAQGFKHTGESVGSLISFHGIDTYVTGKESNQSKVILFLTDIIGHKFINAQLLADEFASRGYYVIVPDLFNGDPVPLNPSPDFDLRAHWLPKHLPGSIQLIIDTVVNAIHADFKPKFVGSVGYCFGAKYVARLLATDKIQVGCIAHPSFLSIEEIEAIKGPLYISGAETDEIYTEELRAETEKVLAEKKKVYLLARFSNTSHGFAVRGDTSVPDVKWAKEKTFYDMAGWFDRFSS
ncbi:dienelactone hydrolase family protein [Nadsonia fulvescens var. elongata DSM 6958]|uniref:Dienelactone hydrolase family protein n=1 Tax=Nadsonia fulvescens var. elongata DSM 6958 TaxID=857566 RepID=A0A1E3PK18_9ASCO|nr:dienelactone hydrolase family protein [Nadsonia fulvescens var. elongata DSM 6958]